MGVFKDRTGEKYGYLTVLKRGQNKGSKVIWECQCDCGELVQKRTDSLNEKCMCKKCEIEYRKGFLLSPLGQLHPSIKNETCNKYGKLTVIEIDKENSASVKGVVWKCKCECGNEKSVSGKDLRMGLVTSCGCNHIKEEKEGAKYGNLTIIKRVENSKSGKAKYLCKCECGNFCEVTGGDLRSGQQKSCGCLKSKGELTIITLLQENNIKFEKEVRFENCKDIKPLPFDFKVYDKNKYYLIEYDGKQHFNSNNVWSDFNFEITQKHDNIKNQWCKENNIPLIRIPYTHLKDLCLEDLQLETSQFIVR